MWGCSWARCTTITSHPLPPIFPPGSQISNIQRLRSQQFRNTLTSKPAFIPYGGFKRVPQNKCPWRKIYRDYKAKQEPSSTCIRPISLEFTVFIAFLQLIYARNTFWASGLCLTIISEFLDVLSFRSSCRRPTIFKRVKSKFAFWDLSLFVIANW